MQANKNVLVKGRAGLDGVAVAAVFRSWWQASQGRAPLILLTPHARLHCAGVCQHMQHAQALLQLLPSPAANHAVLPSLCSREQPAFTLGAVANVDFRSSSWQPRYGLYAAVETFRDLRWVADVLTTPDIRTI